MRQFMGLIEKGCKNIFCSKSLDKVPNLPDRNPNSRTFIYNNDVLKNCDEFVNKYPLSNNRIKTVNLWIDQSSLYANYEYLTFELFFTKEIIVIECNPVYIIISVQAEDSIRQRYISSELKDTRDIANKKISDIVKFCFQEYEEKYNFSQFYSRKFITSIHQICVNDEKNEEDDVDQLIHMGVNCQIYQFT